MNHRPLIRLALLTLALLALAACKEKPDPGPRPAAKAQPAAVTLCHGSINNLLPRLALDQGYFALEGLTLTLKEMDGKQAVEGLLRGECNFAVSAAPPLVRIAPQEKKFIILATVMADNDPAKIIARRDRGIVTPQDLRGKRVGVKKGIISHLFLDLFMARHGLKPGELSQEFLEPEQFQGALARGEIDAFSMTNKLIFATAKELGDQATLFAEPGLTSIQGILITRGDLPLNLQATPQLLRGLLQAGEFARNQPAAAKNLLAQAYNFSPEEMDNIWARSTIEVALGNSIFAHLEDQYKWQVARGLIPAAPAFPNFLASIAPEYLHALKPEAVAITH